VLPRAGRRPPVLSLPRADLPLATPSARPQKKEQKKWEPPLPTRVGKKKKRGPDARVRLPPVYPTTRCRLKLLKQERIKDYLLLEEGALPTTPVAQTR
jgi:26S proteasome regulatory subunit T2